MSQTDSGRRLPLPANPGGLVLGTVAVGALLSAESAPRETYGRTIGAVALTMLLVWIADSYGSYAGDRLEQREPLSVAGLLDAMRHEVTIMAGAALPVLVLIIGWAVGAALSDAVSAAVWSVAAIITVIEALAAWRAHPGLRAIVQQTVLGAVLGLLIVILKALLH